MSTIRRSVSSASTVSVSLVVEQRRQLVGVDLAVHQGRAEAGGDDGALVGVVPSAVDGSALVQHDRGRRERLLVVPANEGRLAFEDVENVGGVAVLVRLDGCARPERERLDEHVVGDGQFRRLDLPGVGCEPVDGVRVSIDRHTLSSPASI